VDTDGVQGARPHCGGRSRAAIVVLVAIALLAAIAAPAPADSVLSVRASKHQAKRPVTGPVNRPRPGRSRHRHRTRHPPAAPRPRLPAPPAPAPTPTYQNPVGGPTADPKGLSNIGGAADYYLYGTGADFPIKHSTDLIHWQAAGTAFATRPGWVVQNGDWHPWGPSVLQQTGPCPLATVLAAVLRQQAISSSCFYLYYTGLSEQFGVNCVAVASSPQPGGPFTDQGPLSNGKLDAAGRPVGCGDDAGYGNIDPSPFVDTDGREYLYMSTDSACMSPGPCTGAGGGTLRPMISALTLAADHVTVVGPRHQLFSGNEIWEIAGDHLVVEGPHMEMHNGVYRLFFSGGDYGGSYGMGDAALTTPLGPAFQDPGNPILSRSDQVFGPGGGATITGPHGGEWMLYHARLGSYQSPRQLFIDPVIWNPDGSVRVAGPTSTPQSPIP
jgi:beta-xylosidase